MESNRRIWAKAITWQTMGLLMMGILGYLFTGSVQQGGAMALLSCGLSLITFFVHEKLWGRVSWGRMLGAGQE